MLIILAISNLGGTASWTTDVAKVGGWFAILDSFAAVSTSAPARA